MAPYSRWTPSRVDWTIHYACAHSIIVSEGPTARGQRALVSLRIVPTGQRFYHPQRRYALLLHPTSRRAAVVAVYKQEFPAIYKCTQGAQLPCYCRRFSDNWRQFDLFVQARALRVKQSPPPGAQDECSRFVHQTCPPIVTR